MKNSAGFEEMKFPEEFFSVDLKPEFFSSDENFLELLPEPDSDFKVDFVEISRK